jgi:hypothetical protein
MRLPSNTESRPKNSAMQLEILSLHGITLEQSINPRSHFLRSTAVSV